MVPDFKKEVQTKSEKALVWVDDTRHEFVGGLSTIGLAEFIKSLPEPFHQAAVLVPSMTYKSDGKSERFAVGLVIQADGQRYLWSVPLYNSGPQWRHLQKKWMGMDFDLDTDKQNLTIALAAHWPGIQLSLARLGVCDIYPDEPPELYQ